MSIVCGTDFSENATGAARVAAALAKRLGVPMHLVHVVDRAPALLGTPEQPAERVELERQAEVLRSEFGVELEVHLELGGADERLVAFADERGARIVVVSSLGLRKQRRWLLGSVAERVAQSSAVPVLVVRQGQQLEAWALGSAPLRVLLGVERTPASKAALRFARALWELGSCELFVAEVVWPPEQSPRVGLSAPAPLDQLRPELEQSLKRELVEWASECITPEDATFLLEVGWGRVDAHLSQMARKWDSDLLIVGTHQRSSMARLWQGSVSRGVLHGAEMSVACVPNPALTE